MGFLLAGRNDHAAIFGLVRSRYVASVQHCTLTPAYVLLEQAKEKLMRWPFIVLVVIVAVVAWAAYTYFTHSAPLPNFHW
jgi:hypothetical protein